MSVRWREAEAAVEDEVGSELPACLRAWGCLLPSAWGPRLGASERQGPSEVSRSGLLGQGNTARHLSKQVPPQLTWVLSGWNGTLNVPRVVVDASACATVQVSRRSSPDSWPRPTVASCMSMR